LIDRFLDFPRFAKERAEVLQQVRTGERTFNQLVDVRRIDVNIKGVEAAIGDFNQFRVVPVGYLNACDSTFDFRLGLDCIGNAVRNRHKYDLETIKHRLFKRSHNRGL
jgi:hypothetical protein